MRRSEVDSGRHMYVCGGRPCPSLQIIFIVSVLVIKALMIFIDKAVPDVPVKVTETMNRNKSVVDHGLFLPALAF